MTYYPTQKLARIAAGRAARAEYLQEAQRAAADNIYTVARIIDRVLPLATDEFSQFARTCGEPMPQHLVRSLEGEISMWERLQVSLADFGDTSPTSEEHDWQTKAVRNYLAIQEDYLRMQEEMLTSCLVDHYNEQRENILAAAAQVGL